MCCVRPDSGWTKAWKFVLCGYLHCQANVMLLSCSCYALFPFRGRFFVSGSCLANSRSCWVVVRAVLCSLPLCLVLLVFGRCYANVGLKCPAVFTLLLGQTIWYGKRRLVLLWATGATSSSQAMTRSRWKKIVTSSYRSLLFFWHHSENWVFLKTVSFHFQSIKWALTLQWCKTLAWKISHTCSLGANF